MITKEDFVEAKNSIPKTSKLKDLLISPEVLQDIKDWAGISDGPCYHPKTDEIDSFSYSAVHIDDYI